MEEKHDLALCYLFFVLFLFLSQSVVKILRNYLEVFEELSYAVECVTFQLYW